MTVSGYASEYYAYAQTLTYFILYSTHCFCFSQFDLYSKADPVPDPEPLIPYYQALIDKYIPGKVKW